MPNVQIPPGLSGSGDVNHDQTQGGTEGNPHGDSAASGDVSPIQSSSDVSHDDTSGGTAGNPHSRSASDNHGNGAHSSTFAVDGNTQPPENHGNGAHNANFAATDGNGNLVISGELGENGSL